MTASTSLERALTVTFSAWAALHFLHALIYGYLAYLRRAGREYLSFALLSFALGFYCAGSAGLLAAEGAQSAMHAQMLQAFGAAIALGAFSVFVYALAGRERSWVLRASIVWGALGVVLDLGGFCFDPTVSLREFAPLVSFAPRTAEVALTLPAKIAIVGGALLIAYACFDVRAAVRSATDRRAVWIAAVVGIAAWGIDTFARVATRPTFYFFEHVATLGSVVIGYVLIRRYVGAEDALEKSAAELRHALEELRLVQAELVKKEQLAAVGELSAVIAHEVRNPLAVLKNAVSGLRRTNLDEETRDTLLRILDEETDRLNRLVRDLLAYARPVDPQATPVDVVALVEKCIATAQASSPRAFGIDVAIELAGAPASIEGDRDLLERALVNIVENALQAMPNGGRLSIVGSGEPRSGEEMLVLRFRDTGEGMDTLVRSRATEPFFTTRSTGTGLGLAIVERVIRAHGGSVELAKNDEGGTSVSVVLPLRRRSSVPPME